MSLSLKKRIDNLTDVDISELVDDIRALRKDVTKVMRRVTPNLIDSTKAAALDGVSDLSDMISDRASSLYRDASRKGAKTYARGYKALDRKFREQPVASVLIAAGIGMLLSKLLSSSHDD